MQVRKIRPEDDFIKLGQAIKAAGLVECVRGNRDEHINYIVNYIVKSAYINISIHNNKYYYWANDMCF